MIKLFIYINNTNFDFIFYSFPLYFTSKLLIYIIYEFSQPNALLTKNKKMVMYWSPLNQRHSQGRIEKKNGYHQPW